MVYSYRVGASRHRAGGGSQACLGMEEWRKKCYLRCSVGIGSSCTRSNFPHSRNELSDTKLFGRALEVSVVDRPVPRVGRWVYKYTVGL